MLRVTGQPAALPDGGLAAWDGPLERGPVVRPPAVRAPRPWPPDRLAGPDDATGPRAVLLDVRDPERYRGEVEPVDPRPGHVPGARNVPARGGLDGRGRLLPAERLRERFTAAGVGADDDVVVSCGSGVNACHGLLALEVAGLGPGWLWPGSGRSGAPTPTAPPPRGTSPDPVGVAQVTTTC